MSRNYSFIPPLASDRLPNSSPSPGFAAPQFVDMRAHPDAVVLLLDRSNSMSWHPDDDFGEVCNNGRDDDRDGTVDEPDCSRPRIDYLQASARAFIHAASADEEQRKMARPDLPDLLVGLVSFNQLPKTHIEPKELPNIVNDLETAISGLTPSGITGIGNGLYESFELLSPHPGNKVVLLISDGQQNCGDDPLEVVEKFADLNITVHTISLGAASDTKILTEIADILRGENSAKQDSRSLIVSVLTSWTQMNDGVLLIPEQRYHTNSPWLNPDLPEIKVPEEHDIPDDAWFTGKDLLETIPEGATINRVPFSIATGTESFTVVLAGDLPDMTYFAIDATLRGPSGDVYTIDHPGDAVVTHDPYFEMIRVDAPKDGEWSLEVSTARGPQTGQTGSLMVFARNRTSRQKMTVSAPRLVSVRDIVPVRILPTYVNTLRHLAELELQVIDPAGAEQSVSVTEAPDGGYLAEISGLTYNGVHTLWTKARSGDGTVHVLGDSFGQPIFEQYVPPFLMGQTASFFVTDGKDVAPLRREESPD